MTLIEVSQAGHPCALELRGRANYLSCFLSALQKDWDSIYVIWIFSHLLF